MCHKTDQQLSDDYNRQSTMDTVAVATAAASVQVAAAPLKQRILQIRHFDAAIARMTTSVLYMVGVFAAMNGMRCHH